MAAFLPGCRDKTRIPQAVRISVLRLNKDHTVVRTIPCHGVPVLILVLLQPTVQFRSDDRRLQYGFVIETGAQNDAVVDGNLGLAG